VSSDPVTYLILLYYVFISGAVEIVGFREIVKVDERGDMGDM